MDAHVDPPVGHPRLVKLVRDRVGELLPDSTVSYVPIESRAAATDMLRWKLVEEAIEYARNPSLGELADVWEALHALRIFDLKVSQVELEDEADAKRDERGGFDELVGMYVTTSADPRHEGEHDA